MAPGAPVTAGSVLPAIPMTRAGARPAPRSAAAARWVSPLSFPTTAVAPATTSANPAIDSSGRTRCAPAMATSRAVSPGPAANATETPRCTSRSASRRYPNHSTGAPVADNGSNTTPGLAMGDTAIVGAPSTATPSGTPRRPIRCARCPCPRGTTSVSSTRRWSVGQPMRRGRCRASQTARNAGLISIAAAASTGTRGARTTDP